MPKITVTVDDATYQRIHDEAEAQDRTITAQTRRILRGWAESGATEAKQLKIPDPPVIKRIPEIPGPYVNPNPWTPRPHWVDESLADGHTYTVDLKPPIPGQVTIPGRDDEPEGVE